MSYAHAHKALADQARFVPDSPVGGVFFEDLTPAPVDAMTLALIVDEISAKVEKSGADVIDSLDARGSLLGSAVVYKPGLGMLTIRRKGRLPLSVLIETRELEYGMAALEIPASGIELKGKKAVLVDNVLATDDILYAARALLETAGVEVTGLCTVPEVEGLGVQGKPADLPLYVADEE